jgi:hypothetical protein
MQPKTRFVVKEDKETHRAYVDHGKLVCKLSFEEEGCMKEKTADSN